MFYVLIINNDGQPGKMWEDGSIEDGIMRICHLVSKQLGRVLTAEETDAIDLDGLFEFAEGGGVYLLQTEN